ncbi:unnamed protein product [Rhodiola kirilowii]
MGRIASQPVGWEFPPDPTDLLKKGAERCSVGDFDPVGWMPTDSQPVGWTSTRSTGPPIGRLASTSEGSKSPFTESIDWQVQSIDWTEISPRQISPGGVDFFWILTRSGELCYSNRAINRKLRF